VFVIIYQIFLCTSVHILFGWRREIIADISFVLHSFTHISQFLFNKSARQTIKVMSIALLSNFCQTINIFLVINVVFISCYNRWSHIVFHRHCAHLINLHIMCDSVCMIEKWIIKCSFGRFSSENRKEITSKVSILSEL
jgi:hypothetical protein